MDFRSWHRCVLFAGVAALLAGCGSGGPLPDARPSSVQTTGVAAHAHPSQQLPAPSSSGSTHASLAPADTLGGYPRPFCSTVRGPVVTVVANPDTPQPECVIVRPGQRLKIRNATNAFHQRGKLMTITSYADLPPRTVPVGHTTTYVRTFGSYLAPGGHWLQLSIYADSRFLIRLK
jgi:hypothetical protein